MITGSILRQAVASIYTFRQRSLLAVTGVIVGIGAVIAVGSVGKIVREEARLRFSETGTEFLLIRNATSEGAKGRRPVSRRVADLASLTSFCPAVDLVAPSVSIDADARFAGKTLGAALVGVTASYREIHRFTMKEGRFLAPLDAMSRFCVVGEGIAQKMTQTGSERAVGERIKVGGAVFTVVGVVSSLQKGFIRDYDVRQTAFIPMATALRMTDNPEAAATAVHVRSGYDNAAAKEQVEAYLQEKTKIKTFVVTSPEELVEQMEKQMRLLTLLLGAVGSISLVMGGVGIMNAMISSVSDRKKEIGVRRALGASSMDIRDQFLVEALLLSLAGGVLGVVLGIGCSYLIAHFAKWSFSISYLAVSGGAALSCLIGVFFGFYPAQQACRLDPIAALRAE